MLNKQGFNLWADDYDKTVQVSEENNLYPFAGYKQILNTIFNAVMEKKHSKVLDIGFGTGVLTSKLYENGHQIDGLDFSSKMISIAKSKMPEAHLIEWDIKNGLPPEILEKKYDSIVSTYTLHHLSDEEKILFIIKLLSLIKEDGQIFIGDISFQTRVKLDICRQDNLGYWDSEEYYLVYEEIKSALKYECNCEFTPISHCAGVFAIFK
ncbi:class I SAM-dependent methyltransferase [Bacillus sp. ISL-40]|uniref:class I SAM-dependent methyltransferase n=1 Tax=unclassified Bacillus (in: firmicutes) TaxID=185979 RepID=UPI001BE72997|nr:MULTISPECIES: class I SAM-dependent methyltransferase [unclassified Bacillus (in: firmicutes)]MBT2701062.1 class I SAM-dependent methyltransferase [Bacillus sp. ISL-40]MBT2739375.1 class I SAM-dependent methyltransferase [Bacillus sp. ISL-77]